MIYLDTPVTIIDDGTDRSIGIKFSEPDAGDEQIISGVYFRSSHDTKTELNATWYPDKGTLVVDIPNNLINYSGYAKLIIPKTSFTHDALTMKLDVYSPKDTDGASRVHYGEDKYAFVRDFDTTSNQIFIEVATDIVNTDFLRSIVDKIVSEKGVLDQAGTAVDTDTLKNDILNRVTKLIDIKKIQEDIKSALVESINTLKGEQSKSLQNQESKLQGIETKVAALNAETIKSDILEALDTKILTAKTDIINSVDVAQLRLDLTSLITETSKSDIAAAKQYVIKRRGAAGYVAHSSDRNKFCVIVQQGSLPLGFSPTSSKIGNITNDKGVPYGTFYIGGNTDSRQIRLQFLEDVPDNRDITDIRFSNMNYVTDEPWPDRL